MNKTKATLHKLNSIYSWTKFIWRNYGWFNQVMVQALSLACDREGLNNVPVPTTGSPGNTPHQQFLRRDYCFRLVQQSESLLLKAVGDKQIK